MVKERPPGLWPFEKCSGLSPPPALCRDHEVATVVQNPSVCLFLKSRIQARQGDRPDSRSGLAWVWPWPVTPKSHSPSPPPFAANIQHPQPFECPSSTGNPGLSENTSWKTGAGPELWRIFLKFLIAKLICNKIYIDICERRK